jgi:small subunit ribosomal protein S2
VELITVKQLLEAGAHFGHQTSRWHPKMKRYIFTQRNGIHIIDLEQTVALLDKACTYVRDLVAGGKNILFVGTKKQAQESVEAEAKRCGMPFVNVRWLGGMLTNFGTIQSRIDYLVRQEDKIARGEYATLPKKEKRKMEEELAKLNRTMSGFKEMTALPGALFVVDITVEKIALAEAKKTALPIVAMADTNCDPDLIDYPIPSNDDAIKAIRLMCGKVADAVLEGKAALESGKAEVAAAAGAKVEPPVMATEGKAESEAAAAAQSYSFKPE